MASKLLVSVEVPVTYQGVFDGADEFVMSRVETIADQKLKNIVKNGDIKDFITDIRADDEDLGSP